MQLTIAYRPTTFSAVVGHKVIVKELERRGMENSYPQVMLYSGPTGIGKTSLALNVAKRINCKNPQGTEPCNECPSCRSVITEQYDRDIILVDSTRLAKTDIAELEESISYAPIFDKQKVVIIEEVQELFQRSQSAFLKLIEIPRERVYFLFTTMDVSKLNKAFINRCTHYRLNPLSTEDIGIHLLRMIDSMKLKADKSVLDKFATEGLLAIAEGCDGSLRDALSYLERCIYGEIWTTDLIQQEFGFVSQENMMNVLWDMLAGKSEGVKPEAYTKEFYYKSFKFMTNAAIYALNGQAKSEFAGKQYTKLVGNKNFYDLLDVFRKTHLDCGLYYRDDIFLLHLIDFYRILNNRELMRQTNTVPRRKLVE